jgi:hypothetical protein
MSLNATAGSWVTVTTLKNIQASSLTSESFHGFDKIGLIIDVELDTEAPTIALNSTSEALNSGQTSIITFTLSESSTDFTSSDVIVSGGTLSNFSGSGASYTATFKPYENSTENGIISVPNNAFNDSAGNLNQDGSDTNNSVLISINTKGSQAIQPDLTWVGNSGNTYQLFKQLYTWQDALTFANLIGGYLVKVDNDAENSELYDKLNGFLTEVDYENSYAADGGSASYVWLGASDVDSEGNWIWARDGSSLPISRSEWGEGLLGSEPDNFNGDQDYLALGLENWPYQVADGQGYGDAGEWNDIAGTNQLYFVVEFDNASTGGDGNNSPTGTVTITGTGTQGATLTADASALDDADGLGTLSYQWKADGTNISGATSSTYTLTQDEVGKVITVAVSYTDGEGTSESVLSTASAAVTNTNDPVSGAVLITGTATQGQVLTADATGLSDPDGVGAFSYQWKADGTPISGATGSTYALTQAEVGKTITVTASYTDGGGTVESVQSSATSAVANVNDDPTGTVTITGTVRQGETVTANVSALADADGLGTLSYQWKADGTDISGATGSTYTLTQDEVGKVVTVTVSYTDGGSTAESVLSTATAAVENVNDNPTGTVTITGTPTQGQTLTATNTLADADGLGTLSYVWKAGGAVITGATASTYTLTQAEVGKAITVEISYTDNEGTAETVASTATAAVANVNDDPTGSVTITGTASEGEVVTANTSALADADGLGTLIYQWKADGTDITGATASTYTLTQNEGSKAVTVAVSFIDGFGFNEAVVSEATDPINRKPIINKELPTFVATEGSTETRDLAGQIFIDPDEAATVSTSVSLINGNTVPDWLNINFDTGLISATPTAGSAGLYKFRAVAEDEFGAVTSQTFSISVIEDSPLNKVISVEAGDSSVTEAFGNNVVIAAEGNNQIVNFSGNGFVDAGADDDVVIGGRGDDILFGGSGNDVLIGDISRKFSPGDDVLVGGVGNDLLEGRAGADTFVFAPNEGSDIIAKLLLDDDNGAWSAVGLDFDVNEDLIDLSAFGINSHDQVMEKWSQGDQGAFFEHANTEILLMGVILDDLSSDNFIL